MARKSVLSQEELKQEALQTALTTIERKYGQGSVMRLSDEAHQAIPCIPTGSIALDLALGIGGIPRGRVTEIYGPESSGKTTLTLHIIAEAQKRGGVAAFIDAEHALDVNYAKRLGVKTDELLVSQPDYGEQALEIADLLVRSGAVDVVVVDSVAALIPQAELDGTMGETQVGGQARLMSHAMRKLTGTIHKSRTSIVFINQIRMKIGMTGYGSPETTTGGNALKFYASVRLDIRKIQTLKDKEESYGNRVRVKVVKNKVAPPFREAQFDILYGTGISREGELLDMGVDNGVIEKSGSWFAFGAERLGQGKENVRALLQENEELRDKVEAALMEHLGLVGTKAPSASGDNEDLGDSVEE
ncbi:MAG: recombinase RecA [Deltaproteobacteria bacterium]|nr:recombinase RecA [Deltaproteobacteria bacterium]